MTIQKRNKTKERQMEFPFDDVPVIRTNVRNGFTDKNAQLFIKKNKKNYGKKS